MGTNYVHLVGTEQMQRAASSMRDAASDMQNAVSMLDSTLEHHRRWMDDWLARLADVMKPEAPRG